MSTNETSRAELFAQEVLGDPAERIRANLRDIRVVVGLPKRLANSRLGQIGLVTVTNILCRLGSLLPNLYLDIPAEARVQAGVPLLPPGQPLGEYLLKLTQRLASVQPDLPKRCRADTALRYDYGVFIGSVTVDTSRPVTVGANRWLGSVRTDGLPEALHEDDSNPMGMILAATLGSIEVVKRMWLPIRSSSVVIEPLNDRLMMSAYDFRVNAEQPTNPQLPSRLDLGHACVFGLGAIGSGCMYVLGCLSDLHMSLDLVDMDVLENSNFERLFSGTNPEAEVGQKKVLHAQHFIQRIHGGVTAFAHGERFQDYVDHARDRLGYVWCGLDSADVRRQLQLELPSVVANGATDASRCMFSVHEYARRDHACLLDLYQQQQGKFDAVGELADLIEMDISGLRRLIRAGQAVERHRILSAFQRVRRPGQREALACLARGNYDFAIHQLCSAMRPHEDAPAATISFVSLLPAVFMVSDLMKRQVYDWQPSQSDPNVFQFDTFRHPTRSRHLPILASRQCECQSEHYQSAFETRQGLRRRHLGIMFTSPAHPRVEKAVT